MQTSQWLSAEQLVQLARSQLTQLDPLVVGASPRVMLQVPQISAVVQTEQLTTLQT